MFTRRDFGKAALAALSLARASAFAKIDSKINGVQLGVQTYSFREFPPEGIVDAVIKAMMEIGLGECEVFTAQFEPIQPRIAQGDAAGREKARKDLRDWRLGVSLDHFKGIKKKFDDAGIRIYAYNYSFNKSFSDDEIERGFEFAKTVGARVITASTTLSVAKRVAPFADKHKMIVAMHGHSNIKDPEEFAKPESFQAAMDMSKYFWVNLDIGHFFAAGYDPVAYINEHHARISNLHLKDRKKDQGDNMPWGQGDTPIKQVLMLLKEKKYPIPGYIEYEYRGTEGPIAEVKKCFAYAKSALA
ncbi:MAG TPA: TIM barrel protein [Bryobacteraceae bacterium]|nr:TIM barrel protein [Bryobacteraceae bacterium]